MVRLDLGDRISDRVTRYLFCTVVEEDADIEPIVDKAKETTDHLLQRAYGVIILVWAIDAVLGYQLPAVVYGIALATMGSFEMMAIRFLDARADLDPVAETMSIEEKLVQTIFGLGLFFLGFAFQFYAYLFPPLTQQVTWIPSVSQLVSNGLLFVFFLPFAVSWLRLKDIAAVVSFLLSAFLFGAIAHYIDPSLTGIGLLFPVFLFEIGFVIYGFHKFIGGVETFFNRSRGSNEDPNLLETFFLHITYVLLLITGMILGVVNKIKLHLEDRLPDFLYSVDMASEKSNRFRQSELSDFYDLDALESTDDEQLVETNSR